MVGTTASVNGAEISALHIDPGKQPRTWVVTAEISGLSEGVRQLDLAEVRLTRLGAISSADLTVTSVNVIGNLIEVHIRKKDTYFGDLSVYELGLPVGENRDELSCRFSLKTLQAISEEAAAEKEPRGGAHFEIDYMARDFQSLIPFFYEQMSRLIPNWRERHAPDEGVALVELLAYAGDYFSYFQDAIGTEAYLETARLRTSARRHARLLGYRLHEGCSARAFVHVAVNKLPLEIPRDTLFLSGLQQPEPVLLRDTFAYRKSVELGMPFYASLHAAHVHPSHNRIEIHTWERSDFVLSEGSTRTTLRGPLSLAVGDVLAFEEERALETGLIEDANPKARCLVRLTGVRQVDWLVIGTKRQPLYEVTWDSEDALPFDMPVALQHGAITLQNLTVARGNMILVEHGLERPSWTLPEVSTDRYRPSLGPVEVSFRVPYHHAEALLLPAAMQLSLDPCAAMPAIELTERDPTGRAAQTWTPRWDLLGCGPFDRCFVVEINDDGHPVLRFGNGSQGWRPDQGHQFEALVRIGKGTDGNVSHDTITTMIVESGFFLHAGEIVGIRNPLPAKGGHDPESVDRVRRYAPEAYQRQDRCVTERDYAERAGAYPEVERAVARMTWTGSWHTVALLVDRKGGQPVDSAFRKRLRAYMAPFCMAGIDLEIGPPEMVALEITLDVHVARDYARNAVRKQLLDSFSSQAGSSGSPGFFHPDRWTFGQVVYLSRVLTRALEIEGVDWVSPTVFQRMDKPEVESLRTGMIEIGPLEVVRLDNNPAFPEMGVLTLNMSGGL